MNDTWFTSDTHFGHTNILKYEQKNRVFDSIEEMNEKLIENWNNVVKPKDTIYHLGDFAFGRHNVAIAGRLNGKKRLIMGNHDAYGAQEYLKYFDKVFGMLFWKKCVLSHAPVIMKNINKNSFLNVHGHLHSGKVLKTCTKFRKIKNDKGTVGQLNFSITEEDIRYFNVSVERHGLTPVHSDLIMERLKELDK